METQRLLSEIPAALPPEKPVDHKAEQRKSRRREALFALALISPYLIIFILFGIFPVVMGVVMSFMRYNPYAPDTNEFVGFMNFQNIFNFDLPISRTFWQSFSTMLLFDVVAVPIMMVIPLVLAYFINMRPPGYKIFRAIIYMPSVVSITVLGVIFGNMFASDSSGLINAWLNTEISWLSGRPWAGDTLRWLVMLIASIWWQTGSNFVIFAGALRNVPKSLYEACEMDGGNRFRRIVSVTLPNIRPALSICLFNTLVGYLGLYGQPYVLNEIDNENILVSPMMFIQYYLSGGMAYARQTGYICACAIVFGLVVMFFTIIERTISRERRKKTRHADGCRRYCADKNYLRQEAAGLPDEAAYGEGDAIYDE